MPLINIVVSIYLCDTSSPRSAMVDVYDQLDPSGKMEGDRQRQNWDFFLFNDTPLDACNQLFGVFRSEQTRMNRMLRTIKRNDRTEEQYKLYPYQKPDPPDPSLLSTLWQSSIIRLVLWRYLFFMLVANAWFALLQYVDTLRMLTDAAETMYSILIFFIGLIFSTFISTVLAKYRTGGEQYQLLLQSVRDFTSTITQILAQCVTRTAEITAYLNPQLKQGEGAQEIPEVLRSELDRFISANPMSPNREEAEAFLELLVKSGGMSPLDHTVLLNNLIRAL